MHTRAHVIVLRPASIFPIPIGACKAFSRRPARLQGLCKVSGSRTGPTPSFSKRINTMAKAYDAAHAGEDSMRLLTARLAQSSLSQETATVHVLPSTCTPGEALDGAGGVRGFVPGTAGAAPRLDELPLGCRRRHVAQ